MIFNKKIAGYENEDEFAFYLNGKQVGRVYPNFLDLLYKLYGYLDYKDYIECWVNKSKRKQIFILRLMDMLEVLVLRKELRILFILSLLVL